MKAKSCGTTKPAGQATLTAGEVFKDIDGKFRPDQEWSLEVTDERRKPLYSINISARKK
jgi:hypothetical protein